MKIPGGKDRELGIGPSNWALEMGRKLEISQSRAVHSSYSLVIEGMMEEDSLNPSRDPGLRTFHFGFC